MSVDMWSIGCIIAEMFNKKVFIKADSSEEYVDSIVQLLGMPDENIQKEIKNKKLLCEPKQVTLMRNLVK